MSKVGRSSWVAHERATIIGKTPINKRASEEARRWNASIDYILSERRKQWTFLPPDNVTCILHRGGLILSVPQPIGRMLLHKRVASILEHDVTIDAVIDGTLEEFIDSGFSNGITTKLTTRSTTAW